MTTSFTYKLASYSPIFKEKVWKEQPTFSSVWALCFSALGESSLSLDSDDFLLCICGVLVIKKSFAYHSLFSLFGPKLRNRDSESESWEFCKLFRSVLWDFPFSITSGLVLRFVSAVETFGVIFVDTVWDCKCLLDCVSDFCLWESPSFETGFELTGVKLNESSEVCDSSLLFKVSSSDSCSSWYISSEVRIFSVTEDRGVLVAKASIFFSRNITESVESRISKAADVAFLTFSAASCWKQELSTTYLLETNEKPIRKWFKNAN